MRFSAIACDTPLVDPELILSHPYKQNMAFIWINMDERTISAHSLYDKDGIHRFDISRLMTLRDFCFYIRPLSIEKVSECIIRIKPLAESMANYHQIHRHGFGGVCGHLSPEGVGLGLKIEAVCRSYDYWNWAPYEAIASRSYNSRVKEMFETKNLQTVYEELQGDGSVESKHIPDLKSHLAIIYEAMQKAKAKKDNT